MKRLKGKIGEKKARKGERKRTGMKTEFGRWDNRNHFVFHVVRGGGSYLRVRTYRGALFLKGEHYPYPTYQNNKPVTYSSTHPNLINFLSLVNEGPN